MFVKELEVLEKSAKENGFKINGADLSFASVPEFERTKHVHRLHPYLGKFIPQLVDYFLKRYFQSGQIVLDPYVGSGTTPVEANILGINSVGVEVSEFNCLISKIKTNQYDIEETERELLDILNRTINFSKELTSKQNDLSNKDIDTILKTRSEYLNTWFSSRALKEILFYRSQISDYKNQDLMKVILSRSARSARQITHYDLARPQKPIKTKYYCIKHRRYCQPTDEALKFLIRYTYDTVRRIKEFNRIKTKAFIKIYHNDARTVKLPSQLLNKIDGIITSPPYVGMIDYHDQHRYAYELFNFEDLSNKEIGPMSNGKSLAAKSEYRDNILAVMKNLNCYLKKGAKIFYVVNDRDNLYPEIAKESGLKIKEVFYRPVLKRTERDNVNYSESIYYFIKE